jgi:hypothetical protein
MTPCEELLTDVSIRIEKLRKVRNDYSEYLPPDFKFFNYFRVGEIEISGIMADLLNPQGTHGQGSNYLKIFLQNLGISFDPHEKWKVEKEKWTDERGRLDIYLSSNKSIIAIENKPWAREQDNQVTRYVTELTKNSAGKKWLLLYIGNNPPKTIDDDVRRKLEEDKKFILVSFLKIERWISDCKKETKALPVSIFLDYFLGYIRTEVNGEIDMNEQKETVDVIMKSEETIKSAFLVSGSIESLKKNLIAILMDDLKKAAAHSYKIDISNNTNVFGKYYGFKIKKHEEQDISLQFEFQGEGLNKLIWGFAKEHVEISRVSSEKKINDIMSSSKYGPARPTEWWPWYSETIPFGPSYSNWSQSADPWVSIHRKELAQQIIDLADEVYKLFEENKSLNILFSGDKLPEICAD